MPCSTDRRGPRLMVQLLDATRDPVALRHGQAAAVDPEPSRPSWNRVISGTRARPGRPRRCEMPSTCGPTFENGIWSIPRSRARHLRCPSHGVDPPNQPHGGRSASPGRRCDSLDKLRRDTGSTVNDVVLTGAFVATFNESGRCRCRSSSRWCRFRPVSVRRSNQLSALITTLATDVAAERFLSTAHDQCREARHDETGLGSLVGLTDVVPPRTGQAVARLGAGLGFARCRGPLAYNVVVSNVPGPDTPFCATAPSSSRPTE